MSLCHKLWFSNFNIFATKCCRPLIFQTISSARAYNLSLKYLRWTPSGSIDIGVGKFEFVAKTQILSLEGDHSFGVPYRISSYSLYLYCTASSRKLKFSPVHKRIQTDWSNNLSLNYQRFTRSGCKDIWVRKFEFELWINFFVQ